TSSVGIGISIVLFVLMQGIALGGKVPNDTAEILVRLWIAGVIPFLVGLALIINGLVVGRKLLETARANQLPGLDAEQQKKPALKPADTNEFIPANYSVTDQTTQHLESSGQRQRSPVSDRH